MRFFINLSSLRLAGGKRVALGMLQGFKQMEQEGQLRHEIIALVPPDSEYIFDSREITFEQLPQNLAKFYNFFRKEKWFKRKVAQYTPDAIFEFGNIAMPISDIPQLLLIQWPYVAYPESIVWNSMSFFSRMTRKVKLGLIQRRLRYANSITVQTEVMKDRLKKNTNWYGPMHIVQSAVGERKREISEIPQDNNSFWIEELQKYTSNLIKVLYLTRYYSHKNIEILLEAAKYAKKHDLNIQFLTTLSPYQGAAVETFLDEIDHNNLRSYLLNLNEIPQDQVYTLMDKVDALVMPTLLETYGLPYFEAMKSGLPVFTSDMDFAHDACGDVGFYFDPLDGRDITKTIHKAFENPYLVKQNIAKGREKVEQMPCWKQVAGQYIQILENMEKGIDIKS